MVRITLLALIISFIFINCGEDKFTKDLNQHKLKQELITLEDQWAKAVVSGDISVLSKILADEYIVTTASGNLKGKSEYLEDFTSGVRKISSLNSDDLQIKIYDDIAILFHGGKAQGSYKDKDVTGSYRWTHVFVHRDERWQCVANQVTPVAQ